MSEAKQRLRVYVVEDSARLRSRLTELLEGIGVEIAGYADVPDAAIREIASLKPDVVIIDVALRRGTGFDVVRALDLAPDGAFPTMMILSNYGTRPFREAARKLGVSYYFDKSSEVHAMLRVLSSMARGISLRNGSEH